MELAQLAVAMQPSLPPGVLVFPLLQTTQMFLVHHAPSARALRKTFPEEGTFYKVIFGEDDNFRDPKHRVLSLL
jgi:hypothetical protein